MSGEGFEPTPPKRSVLQTGTTKPYSTSTHNENIGIEDFINRQASQWDAISLGPIFS